MSVNHMSSSSLTSPCDVSSAPPSVSAVFNNSLERKASSHLLASVPGACGEATASANHPYSRRKRGSTSLIPDQGTETKSLVDFEDSQNWTGRGRSPYKTPVTAVLDNIRGNARLLQQFERNILSYQDQLQDLALLKSRCSDQLREQIDQPLNGEMAYLKEVNPFEPSSGRATSRSVSPDKYLGMLRNADPPIEPLKIEQALDNLLEPVYDVLKQLSSGLDEGYLPTAYKVRRSLGETGIVQIPGWG